MTTSIYGYRRIIQIIINISILILILFLLLTISYYLFTAVFFLSTITNELETNNIPSLIPAEIKLSDGEYGKYLTNLSF